MCSPLHHQLCTPDLKETGQRNEVIISHYVSFENSEFQCPHVFNDNNNVFYAACDTDLK